MTFQQQLTDEVKQLIPDVRLIYLFGSVASETDNQHSDIDLAVLLPSRLPPVTRFDIEQTLAITLQRDVDLVDLLAASTVMQQQVIQTGCLLLGSEAEQDAFEMQVLAMYQRLQQERADILAEYLK